MLYRIIYGILIRSVLGFSAGWAQSGASLRIAREDKTIRVAQDSNATSASGAKFIPSNPNCEEGLKLGTIFAPAPYLVETLVNDTKILSNIALLRRPNETQEQEKLELLPGSVSFDEEKLCPSDVTKELEALVTLIEGRTTIKGGDFRYDNATGIGTMQGPIQLQREATEDGTALSANAQSLSFDVDNDLTILEGEVSLEAEGRSSKADRVEFDEQAGIAILRGNPAESRKGDELVQGNVIEYFLDSNDVVVKENILASFDLP
ncbi:MAG: hypothetical protein R2880_01470 [Deinococcales bacterium]